MKTLPQQSPDNLLEGELAGTCVKVGKVGDSVYIYIYILVSLCFTGHAGRFIKDVVLLHPYEESRSRYSNILHEEGRFVTGVEFFRSMLEDEVTALIEGLFEHLWTGTRPRYSMLKNATLFGVDKRKHT